MRALLLIPLLLACAPPPKEAPPDAPAPTSAPGSAPGVEADPEPEDDGGPWLSEAGADAHPDERIAARHILVSWEGALRANGVRRSRAEARTLAEELRRRLVAGEDFATLARTYSDDPATGKRGGALGAFGHGVMQREFEDAAFALSPGTLSDLVETPFGFHLIERQELIEARLAEIVVRWDAVGEDGTPRPREATRALAEQAAARLADGEPFARVASALSEGPAGPWGGELGWFQEGQLSPTLDQAAFALKPGKSSPIVESALGLHILHRLE